MSSQESNSDVLKSRAIKTVYRLIECSKDRVDQNDILALGMFLGGIDTVNALKTLIQEYQRLVNTYHEDYPHRDDLQSIKDDLERKAAALGI